MDAPRPYRPSNGTEGAIFQARFCERCDRRGGEGVFCAILINSEAFKVGDPGYPAEWVWGPEDAPICTAFEEAGYAARRRQQERYDALARDPATGRPVIA